MPPPATKTIPAFRPGNRAIPPSQKRNGCGWIQSFPLPPDRIMRRLRARHHPPNRAPYLQQTSDCHMRAPLHAIWRSTAWACAVCAAFLRLAIGVAIPICRRIPAAHICRVWCGRCTKAATRLILSGLPFAASGGMRFVGAL